MLVSFSEKASCKEEKLNTPNTVIKRKKKHSKTLRYPKTIYIECVDGHSM